MEILASSRAKNWFEAITTQSELIIEYHFRPEKKVDKESKNLLVLLPGLGTKTLSQDNSLRRILSSVSFASLTGKFSEIEETVDYDQAATELFTLLSKEYKNREIILFASSLGGIITIKLLQLLNSSNSKLNIKAVCLLMPCINENSINAHIIHILKQLPQELSLSGLALAYEIKAVLCRLLGLQYFPGDSSLKAKYARLVGIPSFDKRPIEPNIPLSIFFSENDRYINSKRVLDDLGKIAPNNPLKIEYVEATGINGHDFRPQEWLELAEKHFRPIFTKVW